MSKKIKKSIGLKGDPTIYQMKVGLNLQDREDQKNRDREVHDKLDGVKYIIPETPEPREAQKRLKAEVNNESRSVGNAKSQFIEDNKKQFMDVSTLNLRRAEQIRKQMNEQRRIVIDKLNKENPRKNLQSSHHSARNDGTVI